MVVQSAEVRRSVVSTVMKCDDLFSTRCSVINFKGRELLICRLLDNTCTLVHRRILQHGATEMKLNADNKILRSTVNAVVQQVLTTFPLMFLYRGEETIPAFGFQNLFNLGTQHFHKLIYTA